MKAENPSTLILYDGRDGPGSYSLATGLQQHLAGPMQTVVVGVEDYAQVNRLPENGLQNLILVYSPHSPKASQVVDDALTRIVERRMRSIVAVTTAATSLPSEWASIPAYDASSFRDQSRLAQSVWNATQHVKVPYSQAVAARSHSQRLPALSIRGRRPTAIGLLMTALLVATLLVVVAATWLFVIVFPNNQRALTLSAHSTVTASAKAATSTYATNTALLTNPQPTPDAMSKELASDTKPAPIVDGFRQNEKWDSKQGPSSCAYDSNNAKNYVAAIMQGNQYTPCIANGSQYKNFVLQVTMDIKGDAGGVIFRDDNAKGIYYRLSVNQIYGGSPNAPLFSLFLCEKQKCDGNDTNAGTQVGADPTPLSTTVDKQPLTLTVIAQGKNFDIFVNGKFLKRFIEANPTGPGLIGMHAADLGHDTTVTFSNLKIWSL